MPGKKGSSKKSPDKKSKSSSPKKSPKDKSAEPPVEENPVPKSDPYKQKNENYVPPPSILDTPPPLPNIFSFDEERMRIVNKTYQLRLEARNNVPCMIAPGEGEFVPEGKMNIQQKVIDQMIDELPAAKIPSRFMETLVGFISFYDKKSHIYYRQYQLKSDYRLVLDMIEMFDYEHYPRETFRYFLQNWPDLCILAFTQEHLPIGVIIGERIGRTHGYIAYTFVNRPYRRKKVGSHLVKVLLNRMHKIGIREVTTEVDSENNLGLLTFYDMMGFIKDRFLLYYYRNGWSAWRMKMWIYPYDLDYDKYQREVLDKIQYLKTNQPTEEEIAAKKAAGSPGKKDKSKDKSKDKTKSKEKSPKKAKK